jgi:hypothetical protein
MASADPVSSSSILYEQKDAANVCFAYGSIYLSPYGQNAHRPTQSPKQTGYQW